MFTRITALVVLSLSLYIQSNVLTVLTYNIRRAGKETHAYRCWEHRKKHLAQQINDCNADIIGLQEVTPQQLHYLRQHLDSRFSVTGTIGRGHSWKGKAANEANPIFYDNSRFTVLKSDMIRLNNLHTGVGRFKALFTPKKHGLLPRICNWVILKEIGSDRIMLVFNTHLDNMFNRARINGLKRIAQCIQSLQKLYSPNTTILMGDFNTNLTCKIQQPIRSLHDTRQHAKKITGPHYTHPGWDHDQNSAIDHILINAEQKNCIEQLEVIDYSPSGLLLSDHWPVKATLKLS